MGCSASQTGPSEFAPTSSAIKRVSLKCSSLSKPDVASDKTQPKSLTSNAVPGTSEQIPVKLTDSFPIKKPNAQAATSSTEGRLESCHQSSSECHFTDTMADKKAGCLRSSARSKWPIRCYAPLSFNVNNHEGGACSLALVSNAYGADGTNTTAEIFLFRSGYNCNHFGTVSIAKSHKGHFGPATSFLTDENGNLILDCLFGTNHVMFLTNQIKYGHLGHGYLIKGFENSEEPNLLHLNVNGNRDGMHGGGATLVLCSAMKDSEPVGAVYLIRSGHKGNAFERTFIKGEDIWEFTVDNSGYLYIRGGIDSVYTVYHNRKNHRPTTDVSGQAMSYFSENYDGSAGTTILNVYPNGKHASVLVLCSHSCGHEDATSASLYLVFLSSLTAKVYPVSDSYGEGCIHREQWDFKVDPKSNHLRAFGPPGPCRFAIMSNINKNLFGDAKIQPVAPTFLVPGIAEEFSGNVNITPEEISGNVTNKCAIHLVVNGLLICRIPPEQLTSSDSKWTFQRSWLENEVQIGIILVQIFADQSEDGTKQVELTGSPHQIVTQPKGVLTSVNCAGPSFHSVEDDIVYVSEHSRFANFSYDYNYGSRSKCLGGVKVNTSFQQQITGSQDGFLYATSRSPGVEAVDEQTVNYAIDNIPNGHFKLRIHCLAPNCGRITINGEHVSSQIQNKFSEQTEISAGYHARHADVSVIVSTNKLEICSRDTALCAFALLNKDFPSRKSNKKEEKRKENELSESVPPIARTFLKKKMKIIGWSENLLQNASGEQNSLVHWNPYGNWAIHEGGYGTEKAFMTSYMKCTKQQEIDLTDYFTTEYLDSVPEIQVSEWYREGVCGGGYYSMTAALMDENGTVIKKYSTGEIGKIYENNKWMEANVVFSDYGPGVRCVSLESTGKDDKFWQGHYGPLMSAAVVRVKRESQSASNDVYADIDLDFWKNSDGSKVDKFLTKVLSENCDFQPNNVSTGSNDEEQTLSRQKVELSLKQRNKSMRKTARKKREIRLFVSSTFRDFTKEREELIKKTFKEINQKCLERGIFFTYVDLRWGITTEQTKDGKTVAICLQEIDRCRPYFVCLLGNRFGWSQQPGKTDELLDGSISYAVGSDNRFAWVEDYRYGSSVTQLEIYHGVLNDVTNRKDRSCFYLRQPPVTDEMDTEELKVCQAESPWHHEKQQSLRETILKTPGLNIKEYKTKEEVCKYIKKDVIRWLDNDFPKGSEPSPLERQREAHEAFADVRCRIYIGGEKYFQTIENLMKSNSRQPIVILGKSGSGKSAFLANWSTRQMTQEPDAFFFVHFIGSSSDSASYLKMLYRLYEELKDHFGFDCEIPTNDTGLVQDLSQWLQMASSIKKCVIIFDALNQLDDGSGIEGPEHDLRWIPNPLPSDNVKIVMSTLPGKAYESVKRYQWPTLQVEPLNLEQKREIITEFFEKIYSKTLNTEQKELIQNSTQTDNPLYLRALLDEVRMYGSFFTLTDKIKEYLEADSPKSLFSKILQRLEEDYADNKKSIVKETTVAIWCSKRGMSEEELRSFVDIPSATWSPFYLSLADSLINKNGIYNFFHDYLRQAVETRYLPTKEHKNEHYKRLSKFFASRPMSDRVATELPYLYAKSDDLNKLHECLCDLELFQHLVKSEDGKFELIRFWKLLGDFNQVDDDYLKKLEEYKGNNMDDKYLILSKNLGEFFFDLGLLDGARKVLDSLLQNLERKYSCSHVTIISCPTNFSWKRRCSHETVIDLLELLGRICTKQKQLEMADNYYREMLSRLNRIRNVTQKLQLCKGLLGLATVFYMQGNMKEAKKLLLRALEQAKEILGHGHHYVAIIINKLGQLCFQQGRLDESLGYFMEDLKLTRNEVGSNHPRIASVLNDIALVFDEKGQREAEKFYECGLALLLGLYGNGHVDVAMMRYNLGTAYFASNYFAKAQYQWEEALKVFESFFGTDHPDTIATADALQEVTVMVDS